MELLLTLHSVNLPVALSQTCVCTQQENQTSNLIEFEEERTQVDEQPICDYDLPASGFKLCHGLPFSCRVSSMPESLVPWYQFEIFSMTSSSQRVVVLPSRWTMGELPWRATLARLRHG